VPVEHESAFGRLVDALAGREGVTVGTGRGFGAGTLKLPAKRVAELIASGEGSPFDAGKGRPMKEWVTLDERTQGRLRELALEAHAFVRRGR
jgi:hypothetical protein